MTIKQFKTFQIIFIIVLAILFSQPAVYKNIYLSLPLLAGFSLLMLLIRRQIKGVVNDERDYAVGGKAALLAMNIYAWVGIVAIFSLYSFSPSGAGEAVAVALSSSICFLFLLYATLFRYYEKGTMKNWGFIASAIILVLFCAMIVAGIMFSIR